MKRQIVILVFHYLFSFSLSLWLQNLSISIPMKKSLLVAIMMLCLCGGALGQEIIYTCNTRGTSKIDPSLNEAFAGGGERSDLYPIIVVMELQYEQEQMNRSTQLMSRQARRQFVVREMQRFTNEQQADVLREMNEKTRDNLVIDLTPFWAFNGFACKATREVIENLATRSDVKMVCYDKERCMLPEDWSPRPCEALRGNAWNVTKVQADLVWETMGYTGNGVVVAVIDTGVNYNHADIVDNMWDGGDNFPNHGYDFVNGDNDPMDDHGHGTHCSGTVAGYGTNGIQTGIAPGAKIMSVKVLNAGGNGSDMDIVNGIQFAIEYGADVLSLSLGAPGVGGYYYYRQVFETVLEAGVVAAVAAGNDGDDLGTYPVPYNIGTPGSCPPPYLHPDQSLTGGLTAVICTGATDRNDTHTYFTSVGPSTWAEGYYIGDYNDYPYIPGDPVNIGLIRPDVAAPGQDIISLYYGDDQNYIYMSGTSMATPCNAGVMALMLEANPNLTPAEIDCILENTAVRCEGSTSKNNYTGSGRIDALNAISALSSLCETPSGLSVTRVAEGARLTWNAVEGVSSYNIYRNDTPIATVEGTSYDDAVTFPGTYKYFVKSICSDGSESLPSQVAMVAYSSIVCAETYHGSIASSHDMADAGTLVTVMAAPEQYYRLSDLYYVSETNGRTNIDMETMQFRMPAFGITIHAKFMEPELVVSAKEIDGNVNVDWYHGKWMDYDIGDISYSVSPSEGGDFYWGIMFPADMLLDYAGWQLERVFLFDGPLSYGDYTLRIHFGGDNAPDSLVYSEDFSLPGGSENRILVLPKPLLITGNENVWVTFYNFGAYAPATACDSYDWAPNGGWESIDGINWFQGYSRFMIKALISNPNQENGFLRSIFRVLSNAKDGEPVAEWETIDTNIIERPYVDDSWQSLAGGYYSWGVERYEDGVIYERNQTICNGIPFSERYIPTSRNDNYSMTQTIYTADEINDAGTIYRIRYRNLSPVNYGRSICLYMKAIDKSSFDNVYDWITMSEDDKVYEGYFNLESEDWIDINLDIPFQYDGTSNLLLCFDDNTGSLETDNQCITGCTEYYHRTLRIASDTDIDPFIPPTNEGEISNSCPVIQLAFEGREREIFWSNSVLNRKFNITVDWQTVNGTVTAPLFGMTGDTITVTAIPDEGYYLFRLSTDNTHINASTKQFIMPDHDVVIYAKFAPNRLVTVAENIDYERSTRIMWGDEIACLQYCRSDYANSDDCVDNEDAYWGIMFPPEELEDLGGKILSAVQIQVIHPYSVPMTLNIYKGGENAPGTLICTQEIEPGVSTWEWKECVLDDIIRIDPSNSLWITIHAPTIGEPYYPIVMELWHEDTNANWYSTDGVTWNHRILSYDNHICWSIRGIVADISDERIGAEEDGEDIYMTSCNPDTGELGEPTLIASGVSGNEYIYINENLPNGFYKWAVGDELRWSNKVGKSGKFDVSISPYIYGGTLIAPSVAHFTERVQVEISPSIGFKLSTLFYHNADSTVVVEIDKHTLQFEMPCYDVTLFATFEPCGLMVTAEEMDNTTVKVTWTNKMERGATLTGFNVYRDDCAATNDTTAILLATVNGCEYLDTSWETTIPGHYKWGVEGIYGNGERSSLTWENELEKPHPISVSMVNEHSFRNGIQGFAPRCVVPEGQPVLRTINSKAIAASCGTDFIGFQLCRPMECTFFNVGTYMAYGACYYNGKYYFSSMREDPYFANLFATFDPLTRTIDTISTELPYGTMIEYNPNDGKMYGITGGYYSFLYEIDPTNGNYRELFMINTPRMGFFTITNDGRFIFIDLNDDCFKELDKDSGQVTFLFHVDFDIEYVQDLSIDRETNEIYWAAFNATDFTAPLIRIDLETNSYEVLGYLLAESTAFAILTECSHYYWSNCLQKAGDQCYFTNVDGNKWSTVANWSTNALPDGYNDVVVDGTCLMDVDANVEGLTINNGQSLTIANGKTLTAYQIASDDVSKLVLEDGAQLLNNTPGVLASVKKNVEGFADSICWHFIATPMLSSPISAAATTVPYDLFRYDEPLTYWMQQRDAEQGFNKFTNTVGYLYATQNDTILCFTGELKPSGTSVVVELSNTSEILPGFNLVGNPFPCDATIDMTYYRLAADHKTLVPGSGPIKPCEAVFVKAEGPGQTVTFTRVGP